MERRQFGKAALGKKAVGKKAVWKEGSLGRRQFGKKADGKKAAEREALGKKAIVKKASGEVWEEQAFGKGIGKPKGVEGYMVRQGRRQARAMTLARGVWQQAAPTKHQ